VPLRVLEVAGKASAADEPARVSGSRVMLHQWASLTRLMRNGSRRVGCAICSSRPSSPQVRSCTVAGGGGYHFPLHSVPGRTPARANGPIGDRPARPATAEPAAERRIRVANSAPTAITDDVSSTVRRQYEENPYPRWVAGVRSPWRRCSSVRRCLRSISV
jgi:hypothetical protein